MTVYDKDYHHRHYLAHKQKYIDQTQANKDALMLVAINAKSKPCADCKTQYAWWIMEFDHVRGKKVADVSILVRRGSLRKLLEEIAKCDVVCSNCHADRTYKRLHPSELGI